MLDVFDQATDEQQDRPSGDIFDKAAANNTPAPAVHFSPQDVEFAPPVAPKVKWDDEPTTSSPAGGPTRHRVLSATPPSLSGSPQDIANRALAQSGLPPAAAPAAPRIDMHTTPVVPDPDQLESDKAIERAPAPPLEIGQRFNFQNPPEAAERFVSGEGGYPKIAAGVKQAAQNIRPPLSVTPESREAVIGGINQAAAGGMEAATPAMIAGGFVDPLATAGGLAGGVAGSKGAQAVAKKAGASPAVQELAGNVGGLAGGTLGGIGGARLSGSIGGTEAGITREVQQHVDGFRTILKEAGIDLPEDATLDQANAAYRQAMGKLHPDVNPEGGDAAKNLNVAWDNLKKSGVFPDEPTPGSAAATGSRIGQKLTDLWGKITDSFAKPEKAAPTTRTGAPLQLSEADVEFAGKEPASEKPADIQKQAEQNQPGLAIEPTTIKGESGAVSGTRRENEATPRPSPTTSAAAEQLPFRAEAEVKPSADDHARLVQEISAKGIQAPITLTYDHGSKITAISDADKQVLRAAKAAGLTHVPIRVANGSIEGGAGHAVSGYAGDQVPEAVKPSEIGVGANKSTTGAISSESSEPPSARATQPESATAGATPKNDAADTEPQRRVLSPIATASRDFLSSESGSGSPLLGAPEVVRKAGEVISAIDKAHDRVTDSFLQKRGLGRAYPEVEQHDPQVAADLRELAAGPQYYRSKADAIVHQITDGMSRDQEKGFVLLADKASRDWLQQNRPEDYRKYADDPRVTKALADYKPLEEDLRAKQKALGGPTIDEDYMRRVYAEHIGGIDQPTAKGDQRSVNVNRIITPQMANKKGRNASPEYYVNNGLHEFGPSFATRYVATNLKLAEHEAAIHFLTKATKIENKDSLPESIEYNGRSYFRPDVAKLLKHVTADSPDGRVIAATLGVDQLPKPREIREYSVYDPTPSETNSVRGKKLAQKIQEAALNASGTEFRPEDMDELLRQAAAISHDNHPIYAGPKDIVDAFQSGARHVIPGWLRGVGDALNPISGMVRRQVIGLGFGVPHIKNVLRRVIQTSPGAHLDPRSYARAAKVLFSDELRKRGIAGVNDPAFDALLRHAGISDHGIESYRSYVDSNIDAGRMERAWKVVKASANDWKSFEKQWLADIKAAHEEGGLRGTGKAAATAIAGAVETPIRPMMFMGHHIIFGPGGIDQRARLWLYDLIRSQEPDITDDEMAQRINDQLGRYNKASWTDFQKDFQPFTFFPGWDYSSVAWVLRHPLKSTVPAALLVLIANLVIHALHKNQRQDSTDLSRVHYRNYSIGDNLFSERLGKAQAGAAMRFAQSKMLRRSTEQSLRDSLGGIQSDARAFVGMLNPLVATIPEVTFGKELSTGRDIVPEGDKRRAGKPEKDWGWYVAHKAFPAYSELANPQQSETPTSFALHNVGTSVYKGSRRRHR